MAQNVIDRNGGTLGSRIAVARDEAGFTIRALARALEVDPRTVNRWQSDESDPSIETLYRIARVLGKPPSYFLVEDEKAREGLA